MGKPALRIGDLTAHGGTVTVGKPTVMIGKMPASTLGDMHVCPMTTGPVPHVGGPATLGSTGVMLSKMPGARVSDMHVCVGPPSMGAMGCMTVLLGEAGSGGDAGNAATAAAASSASKKGPKAIKPFDPIEPPSPATEIHWVEVQVVDSAGLPLGNIRYKMKDPNGADIVGSASPEGRIRHDGYARAGSFKIEFPGVENAKWPSAKCKPNEALTLKADASGFTEGVSAMVVIFEERDNGRFQRQLARIPSQVSGGKVEASFTLLKEHYPLPFDPKKAAAFEESPEGKVEYFFFVEIEGLIGLSDKAQFREEAQIEVLGADGKPVGEKDYQIQLIDGSVRKGRLDKDGKATEKDIPVGPYSLKLIGVGAGPVDKKPEPGPGPDPVEGLVFPLPQRPGQSYHKGGLNFGAAREDKGAEKRRANGARVPDWEMSRANAGCDLPAPADTPIFAVKDGKVVRGPTGFSSTGQAIEVDHGDFLARYCELKPLAKPVVKAGDAVKQGDVVGYVARSTGVSMLHLEMYSGKAEGPLTVRAEKIGEGDPDIVKRFRRRADLMDPTLWLDLAALKGEKPAGAGDDAEPVLADDDVDETATATDGAPYDGKVLKPGSTDSAQIKELQEDLLKLGYWVSNPISPTGKGMEVDSSFGPSTEKAVKTFQYEHFVVKADGTLDTTKKGKITGIVDAETGKQIKDTLANLGQAKWKRPGHKAKKKWKKDGIQTTEKDFGTFHQLVPSSGYYRISPSFGSEQSMHHSKLDLDITSFEVIPGEDAEWMMADCWGTKSMVDFLKDVGDIWATKKIAGKAVPAFMVGDVSAINGGPLDPHRTHQDGTGADLNGVICSSRDFTEEWHRDAALELAKLLKEKGATRILFNCHHVIKNVSIAQELVAHHHHFHVDGPGSGESRPADPYTTCNSCGIYSICSTRINKVKKTPSSPSVDYDRTAEKGSGGGLYQSSGSRSNGVVKLSQVVQ